MMKYITRAKYSIFVLLLLSSCYVQPKNNISESVFSVIKNFKLEQKKEDDSLNFMIESPEAYINPGNDIVNIKNSTITIYKYDKPKLIINSNVAIFNRKNNTINCSGDIVIDQIDAKDNKLTAENIMWNIQNSTIHISGDVKLRTNSSYIISDNAYYDQNEGILDFTQIKKYEVYRKSGQIEIPFISINSDNATWDNEEKSLIFYSPDKQVRSTIIISD